MMSRRELTVFVRIAGHGGTSVVYKCSERRTGVVHACKIIDRRAVEREHNVLMEQFQVRRVD